jgi:hypothetical protein
VLRIPAQELDPGPEAGLVVAPGPSRVLGIVNALAAEVAALDNAGAAFLHHLPDQAVLQRFTGPDPAAPSRFQYRSPSPSNAPRTINPASVKQMP